MLAIWVFHIITGASIPFPRRSGRWSASATRPAPSSAQSPLFLRTPYRAFLARFLAPPLQTEPASLGFGLVFLLLWEHSRTLSLVPLPRGVLYGVTMQEQGVSRMLTINLNDVEKELKLR